VKIGMRCICGALLDLDDAGERVAPDPRINANLRVFASEIVADRWLLLHRDCGKVYSPQRVTQGSQSSH
jgi:hypothetical protein